jgi:hypothetical protein
LEKLTLRMGNSICFYRFIRFAGRMEQKKMFSHLIMFEIINGKTKRITRGRTGKEKLIFVVYEYC